MVERAHNTLSVAAQCSLLSISHSGYYYIPATESARNLSLMNAIDRIHTAYPFYGFRRIKTALEEYGYFVGKKLVISLMKKMLLHTVYPKPKTTVPGKDHRVYPYLLRGLKIECVHQVWETDITYIGMAKGYMYLAAIIDVYSRKVLSWQISNTMEAIWCKEILEAAVTQYGCPAIVNTDQGSQFTSHVFVEYVLENKIQLSMDGRGRATDNIYIERFWRSVKQEKIYLTAYQTGAELYAGLKEYIRFYNEKRPHQSLDYQCPEKYFKENLKK
jgi:putative transposase